MKLHLLPLVVLLSLNFSGYGKSAPKLEFFLKVEGTGEKYGPFEFKEDEKIVIGKQTFVIDMPAATAKKRAVQAKLERIVIKELAFREANIEDVIQYLSIQSIELDKDSANNERGVNVVRKLTRHGAVSETEQAAPTNLPPITLTMTLRNVSLMDAIKIITEAAGLEYRIDENGVFIEPARVPAGANRSPKAQLTAH